MGVRATATVVIGYGVAMAYLEAAVVVDLTEALGGTVGVLFPLRPVDEAGQLVAIEAGREAATLVMLAAVGLLAGRGPLERFAWVAVAFGAWDIAYYGWLWVFTGWPSSPGATDLLFLLPVPWVGPVWSPVAVSLALVGVGVTAAARQRRSRPLALRPWHWAAGLAGGALVVLSYALDGVRLVDGGTPGPYPWPLFAAGMALALTAAAAALWRHGLARPEREPPRAAAPWRRVAR